MKLMQLSWLRKRKSADAVVLQASLSTQYVINLTFKHRLAVATVSRAFAEAGGLMSYGVDGPDAFRRSAGFVHKIFREVSRRTCR